MKKGFTLIELLAVIVILAIIALIATPIVLNIIKDSRESAGLRSAEMYLDAVEQSIALEKMNNTNFNPNTCTITTEGNLLCDEKDLIDIEVNGEKPVNGSIAYTGGKITQVELKYKNGKAIVMNNKGDLEYNEEEVIAYISLGNYQHQLPDGTIEDHEVTFDGNGHGTCSKCMEEVLASGLYDENDVMVASWDEFVDDYGLDIEADYSLAGSSINMSSALTTAGLHSTVKKVIIPDGVTRIGNSAFSGCISIKEITIPDSVEYIGTNAFNNCNLLSSIYIPENVTTILGPSCGLFNNCPRSLKIYCAANEDQAGWVSGWNCYFGSSVTSYETIYGVSRAEYEAMIAQ